jgi:hypothetical protein
VRVTVQEASEKAVIPFDPKRVTRAGDQSGDQATDPVTEPVTEQMTEADAAMSFWF